MTFGDILTWVIFAVIVVFFLIGLRHIYRNFISGESDCCGKGGSCSCTCCDHHEAPLTRAERRGAAKAWQAEKMEARREREERENSCCCSKEKDLPPCCCHKK